MGIHFLRIVSLIKHKTWLKATLLLLINARVIRTEPVLNTDDSIEITQRHARDNDVKYIMLSGDFKSLEQREKI